MATPANPVSQMADLLRRAKSSIAATAAANDVILQESTDTDSMEARCRLNQALVNGTVLAVLTVFVDGALVAITEPVE